MYIILYVTGTQAVQSVTAVHSIDLCWEHSMTRYNFTIDYLSGNEGNLIRQSDRGIPPTINLET